jgi:hypothetical protein
VRREETTMNLSPIIGRNLRNGRKNVQNSKNWRLKIQDISNTDSAAKTQIEHGI